MMGGKTTQEMSTGTTARQRRKQNKTEPSSRSDNNVQHHKVRSKNRNRNNKKKPVAAAGIISTSIDDDDDDDENLALEQAYAESQRTNKKRNGTMMMLMVGTAIAIFAVTINRFNDGQTPDIVFPTTTSSPPSSSPTTDEAAQQQPQPQPPQQQSPATTTTKSNQHDDYGEDDDQDKDQGQDKDRRPIAAWSSDWTLLGTYPHDPTAFTQGLEVVSAVEDTSSSASSDTTTIDEASSRLLVIESTGHYGYEGRRGTFNESSVVRIWDVYSGDVITQVPLDEQLFGEGLTKVYVKDDNDGKGVDKEYFLLLTWREHTALLLDTTTLQIQHQFQFETHTRQGWGVTYDEKTRQIYVTDGSHMIHVWELYFVDDDDDDVNEDEIEQQDQEDSRSKRTVRYEEVRRFPVSLKLRLPNQSDDDEVLDRPELHYLNELEWDTLTDTILSNIYFENLVLRICPQTGHVLKVYDFNTLYPNNQRTETADVLNGIAIIHDHGNGSGSSSQPATHQQWLLTGKYWPSIYKVQVEV